MAMCENRSSGISRGESQLHPPHLRTEKYAQYEKKSSGGKPIIIVDFQGILNPEEMAKKDGIKVRTLGSDYPPKEQPPTEI